MNDYQQFIKNKQHLATNHGIEPKYMPDFMFDYQHYIANHVITQGRTGAFVDTGLGKTIIELVTARNYNEHTNKPTLIITPLAVAFQFIKEANQFDICDIEYSKLGQHSRDVVVCNYERLEKFNPDDFGCVILDESSILKNFNGATKRKITSFLRNVRYKFLFTATPSPNDFVELGTSSEALGYLGYTDMLTRFFTNNEDTISPQNISAQWILKGHAHRSFFDWVATWAISMRKPSDLGFSDEKTTLPELNETTHQIFNEQNMAFDDQFQLFPKAATSLPEVRQEQRATVARRCEKAVELAGDHETSVYWCNLNDEGDLIAQIDPNAVQIKGGMDIDKKEEILLAFADKEIKKLITKPKMTAFGLNWQHCNHTVYFPTFSYEQYYQSIRRFHRYGQTESVSVDLVISDGQQRIIDSLFAKAKKANELFEKLNQSINSNYDHTETEFNKPITKPGFL